MSIPIEKLKALGWSEELIKKYCDASRDFVAPKSPAPQVGVVKSKVADSNSFMVGNFTQGESQALFLSLNPSDSD